MALPSAASAALLRQRLLGLLEVALAVVSVRAYEAFVDVHDIGLHLLRYNHRAAFQLNEGEAQLLLAIAIAIVPAALLLTDGMTRLLPGRGLRLLERASKRPRLAAAALAILGGLLVAVIARLVFGYAQFTDDERVYLFQAKTLLAGGLTAPRPGPPNLFHFQFMLPVGLDRWAGVYPPGQPALLALGLLAGAPHMTQVVCAAALIYVAARFAFDLWGAETSVLTAILMTLSPALLCGAASFHNSVPTALFSLVGIRGALGFYRTGRLRDAAIAGAGLGAAFLCRPFDGAALALPTGLLLVVTALRRAPEHSPEHAPEHSYVHPSPRRRWIGCGLAVAAGVPFLLVFLAANRAVTGNPLVPAYAVFNKQWPGAVIFGFGRGAFGAIQTPELALSKTLVVLARLNQWLLGWPLSLLPVLLCLIGAGRDRFANWLLLLLGVHFLAYFFYVGVSVHDLGSTYHLPELPLIAALSARALLSLRQSLSRLSTGWGAFPLKLAAAFGILAVMSFWPVELGYLRSVADSTLAPLRVAARAATARPVLIFWHSMQAPNAYAQHSWVFFPPPPDPALRDVALWVHTKPEQHPELLERFNERTPYSLEWSAKNEPYLRRIDKELLPK